MEKEKLEKLYNNLNWLPLEEGGSNYKTHNLVEVEENIYEYKSSFVNTLFGLIFMIVGAIALIFMTKASLRSFDMLIFLIGTVFSVVFIVIGAVFFKNSQKKMVFNFEENIFWKGSREDSIDLENIVAIQIVSEECSSEDSDGNYTRYYSYELNLVDENAKRYNIIDHGRKDIIIQDAELIAEFLEIPIWDRGL